jgi:hypothetical protein
MGPVSRLAVAAASILALASCASPPPPLPVAVVPPAAPPPPPVALSASVLQAAAAYRNYMNRAAGISPAFADGTQVQQSLMAAAAWEPKQFLGGAIAYAALVALQSPQFVAGVRTYAIDPVGRRDLAARLLADPNYASALPSAASAAGLISAALHADAAKVRAAGTQVKQAAYDVQRQAWSKADVAGRDARLAQAKLLSAQPVTAPEAELQALSNAVTGADAAGISALGVVGDPLQPPYTGVVARGLTLAALAALGEGGEANAAALQSLLEEKSAAFCLNLSKLNLYQCLSVSKPHYEDVFCIGQHILLDTAQCVDKAAGAQAPVAVATAAPSSIPGLAPAPSPASGTRAAASTAR